MKKSKCKKIDIYIFFYRILFLFNYLSMVLNIQLVLLGNGLNLLNKNLPYLFVALNSDIQKVMN